jgi:hypothetical protein
LHQGKKVKALYSKGISIINYLVIFTKRFIEYQLKTF